MSAALNSLLQKLPLVSTRAASSSCAVENIYSICNIRNCLLRPKWRKRIQEMLARLPEGLIPMNGCVAEDDVVYNNCGML